MPVWGRWFAAILVAVLWGGEAAAEHVVELRITFDPSTGQLEGTMNDPSQSFSHRVPLAGPGAFDALPDGGLAAVEGSYLPPHVWWPAQAFDGHGGSFRLTIEVPEGQVAVATARLESDRQTEAGYSATFVGNEPPIVFVGPYSIAERWHEGLRLRTYFPPDMASFAEPYLDRVGAYIDGFGARIGAYPYSHFWVVAAPFPVGLGFPGATYVSARILPLPFMQGRSLAHEVLHNWWGNGARVDYTEGNWSEGLTTYLADYGLAEEAGEATAHEMRLAWLRDITALGDGDDTALTAFVQRHHAASQVVGYDKVAMVFHMLRREIGDAAFDAGLREFWETWQGRIAAWTDLQRAFETEGDLGSFFQQWLTRTGAPALVLENATVTEHNAGWRLSLRLQQGPRPWNLTVPVVISLAEGDIVKLAEVSGSSDEYSWILPSRPLAVAIDPDHHVLRRLAPGEAPPILRDVTLDRNAAVIIASDDPAVTDVAQALASSLLGRAVIAQTATADSAFPEEYVAVVIGLDDAIEELLRAEGLAIPDFAAGNGTARSWVSRGPNGQAVLTVAASNRAALEALQRPLPHYGARSYVVFDGPRAIDKGTLPVAREHPLRVVFE
jgi:aminopeptidase N